MIDLVKYKNALMDNTLLKYSGKVAKIIGLMIESIGPAVEIGEVCEIYPIKPGVPLKGEVVGFKDDRVLLMPLGDMTGIGPGSKVISTGHELQIDVSDELLGRILDGLGNPIDGRYKPKATYKYPANNDPPNPLERDKIEAPMPLGIRAIDALLTCGRGQRIGIFAGSGVGKSTLLGMIAKYTKADINVIALVGERGREVREFIENDLGEEGLKRSVVVVATSDKPALVRVKAALIATSIAEYFRDQNKNVVLMMDSVTRFSMAQREIGLAIGEPPVTRGYTPSVFAVLPKLLERAGNSSQGSITGLYTVLVDGDDFNEPISDAARGILDGHIILTRDLASRGHYPAIDILQSASRVMPNIIDEAHLMAAMRFKEILAVYKGSEDLISIGAYAQGSNPHIDLAISKIDDFNDFLKQKTNEKTEFDEVIQHMKHLVQ
ncbi:flagellar protein export ATPase FliI [Fusibacter ferrireducens]|uniref:Flagellar protein export ATPase FliI n=1 Tax=Fusibacter ferrireducens TaxID=2785058 RepID=A0ABR9ZP72_9FIRM|nr:flagellar protein export ATPase FliI [Fusibacter ferrireducens]MBF4691725.1 flagellar protein export ATPase FliI [Fusibacter ferrireducens]